MQTIPKPLILPRRVLNAALRKSAERAQPLADAFGQAGPTVGNHNVFHDLGFPEPEAQNLLLRADLAIHIRKAIERLGLTQAQAAARAGITQPRMNDLVKGRTHKFTLDALVNVAAQLGYTIKLTMKKTA